MVGTHRMAETARAEAGEALVAGRRRATGGTSDVVAGPRSLLAIQRSAGNAAVTALLAAKSKAPGEQALADIDTALKEIRKDEPALDPVEKGLQAARTAGVPVDLEGPRPPASALAVVRTGFGPGMVAPPKAVPPPKPLPPVNPLGKAAAKPGDPDKGAGKGPAKTTPAGRAPAPASAAGGASAAPTGPAPLSADKLLQPPVAPTSLRPEQDPGFAQVTGRIGAVAASRRAHPPAAVKAKEAQEAAVAPSDDLGAQAKAAKVDTMDAQPVGAFDKKAFIAAVKDAVEAKSPKTLEEADEYKESGKAGEVKGDVKGLVGQGKEGQAKDVEAATEAPPDPSKAVPKPVRPLSPEQPGTAGAVPAAGAVPKPAPPEQTNLAAGKHAAEQEMADAGVTDEQLAQSNEPEFQQAVTDKQTAAAHAETAPAEFRRQEQQIVQQNQAEAAAETAAGVTGMQGAKAGALAQLVGDKGKTKSKDEARRAEVTAKIQGIFAATEADVKKILDGIDPKVEAAFETGEARARQVFENYVDVKMRAYKKDRYGGWLGPLRWAKDKMLGMPSKVDEFYAAGRELYLQEMDGVISRVADIVGGDLTAAKQRIARGRAEITAYAKSLPADLQKVGAEATQEIGDRFAQLESDVDAKQQAVVDTLATKYVESRKGIDERIEAMQAENKGLVDKAVGAIKAVVGTIRELAAMLKNVLSRAAGVVGDIVKNPIGFLGHLIAGVKGGILKFKDNILGHLRKGLMGWLFGALAEGGIELPDTFDLKGVVKLLASLFGLTWARIRARIAKRIGEPAMAAVEKGVEIFQLIATQGVAGLWQLLVEKIGNLKDMILEKVQDFVVTKVITAGITWLISLLNPAAAFIKACKLIYDVVMFFVNNAARLAKFVDTIIDSVADIVRGNVGSVVTKIENVLGQMVPLLIGFLASVLGLGGIGQKIREIVTALQKPVQKALDFIIKTGLKLAGPIIRGLTKLGGKVKAKVAAGKAWVKGKVEASRKLAAGATKRITSRPQPKPGERLDPRQLEWAARTAAQQGHVALVRGVSPARTAEVLESVLDRHRAYGVKRLEVVRDSEGAHVKATVNPTHIWRDGITVSPLHIRDIFIGEEQTTGGLGGEELFSSNKTTARGYFIYNDRGHAFEQMVSSERAKYARNATRSAEGAHAEEQVTNAFEELYDRFLGQATAKAGGGSAKNYDIKLGIDVSVSSCPNCAKHIADFVRRMRADNCKVHATMRFGGLYHGPSKRGPTKGRVIMPAADVKSEQDLVDVFYRRGEVRSVKKGRVWGSLGTLMIPRESPDGFKTLPSGQRVGKLGLAILRRAGVDIQVLKQEELRTPVPEGKSQALAKKAEKLQKALDQVEEILSTKKAS